MKIIGKANNDFILSATRDEVCVLCDNYFYHTSSLEIGDDIDIKSLYEKIAHLKVFLNKKEVIEAMKANLDKIISDINLVKHIDEGT